MIGKLQVHSFEQGSPEWYDIRGGRVTGTSAALLLSTGKKDMFSVAAQGLMYRCAAEKIVGVDTDPYTSFAMERGSILETDARKEYEKREWVEVQQAGFCAVGDWFGFSPDGLVGEDGGIECKCLMGAAFVEYVETQAIDKKHMAQMQWAMFLSGRKWWDYIMYNPLFPAPYHKQRVYPNEAMFANWAGKVDVWVDRIAALVERLQKPEAL